MATRNQGGTATAESVLPGFRPLQDMWSGPNPLYPSETAARWAIRTLRPQLADAEAMAVLGRDLYYHPERVAGVVSRDALERFRRRGSGGQG